ncbi:hypothetical protein OSTOST_02707, partial [Ostertagia ostertagi]
VKTISKCTKGTAAVQCAGELLSVVHELALIGGTGPTATSSRKTSVKNDPAIESMLIALSPMELSQLLESDKRGRSIVISGLDEAPGNLPPSARQRDLEDKVCAVLDVLDVECRPTEIYRMGKRDKDRPRLVKVVLPARSHWRRALANARLLRGAGLPHVFIRRSMTEDERKREYELRKEAEERNKGKDVREWVVYQGQLKHTSELPHKQIVAAFPYFVYRLDRKDRRGGGVCCLVKGNLLTSSVELNRTMNADVLSLELFCPLEHVSLPTHGENTLDLVLSTIPNIRDVSISSPLASSDHASVRFVLLEKIESTYTVPLPDFSRVDYKGLNEHLLKVDWFNVFDQYSSIDDIYKRFCSALYNAFKIYVPMRLPGFVLLYTRCISEIC